MAKPGSESGPPPQGEELKRLASGIIQAQGNRFIKELLRAKGIRIGATKEDFRRNLNDAIDDGKLVLRDVSDWLGSVEGWGDQHVYLFNISDKLKRDLTQRKIHQRVEEAGYAPLWERETTFEFPDNPTLSSISFTDSVLRLLWHEASPDWIKAPERNRTEEDGLDVYEYRAYRKVEHRTTTRFEARPGESLAALFIANAFQAEGHRTAISEARNVIAQLLDLSELDHRQVDISTVSKNMDQHNVPTNARPNPDIKARKSRLKSGDSYVEFASSSAEGAYWENDAVKNVRQSVNTQQLPAFQGNDGDFTFLPDAGRLTRPLRLSLYASGNRVRLWAQMSANEVWEVLKKVASYQ